MIDALLIVTVVTNDLAAPLAIATVTNWRQDS